MGYVEYTMSEKKRALRLYRKHKNACAVERKTGISHNTILRWADEAGIKASKSEVMSKINNPASHPKYDRAVVLYHKGGHSLQKVSDFTGVPSTTLRGWMEREGVLRSRSEAFRVSHDQHAFEERVRKSCRYLVENPHLTQKEAARQLGISEEAISRHWNSKHNPYRQNK